MVLKLPSPSKARILPFENDVKMYGTQAKIKYERRKGWFENDVKMYGTQAHPRLPAACTGLRMM